MQSANNQLFNTTDSDNYEELFGTCTTTPRQHKARQPNVWSPGLRGSGITGEENRVLPCLIGSLHNPVQVDSDTAAGTADYNECNEEVDLDLT